MTYSRKSPADRIRDKLNDLNLLISESVAITNVIGQLFEENVHPNEISLDQLNEITAILFLLKKHQQRASKKCEKLIERHCKAECSQPHVIESICLVENTLFFRVKTKDAFSFVTDIQDIQCRDLRTGDTIHMNKEGGASVVLEKRPPYSTPIFMKKD